MGSLNFIDKVLHSNFSSIVHVTKYDVDVTQKVRVNLIIHISKVIHNLPHHQVSFVLVFFTVLQVYKHHIKPLVKDPKMKL
jgi:hypothetical protein